MDRASTREHAVFPNNPGTCWDVDVAHALNRTLKIMMTGAKPKPKLHLLSGKEALDPEALAKFYAKLTGKPFTPKLVEEFRKELAKSLKRYSRSPEQP